MKKFLTKLFSPASLMIFAILFVAFPALAQEASLPAAALPPDWLTPVVQFLLGIPKVGPVLVSVLSWIATIATVMTSVSICVQTILTAPEILARWAGAQALADKIKGVSEKIMPWLKYFSIFNVQKK